MRWNEIWGCAWMFVWIAEAVKTVRMIVMECHGCFMWVRWFLAACIGQAVITCKLCWKTRYWNNSWPSLKTGAGMCFHIPSAQLGERSPCPRKLLLGFSRSHTSHTHTGHAWELTLFGAESFLPSDLLLFSFLIPLLLFFLFFYSFILFFNFVVECFSTGSGPLQQRAPHKCEVLGCTGWSRAFFGAAAWWFDFILRALFWGYHLWTHKVSFLVCICLHGLSLICWLCCIHEIKLKLTSD